jgi:hypothetical protein
MSKTIKAIERHMILPARPESQSKILPARSKSHLAKIGLHSRRTEFVAEWQQRGPETLSGQALRKLRLALAPTQSVITASATG